MPVTPDVPVASGLHLAVALNGAGWHPAAWREPAARPGELLDASYWTDLAREAEAGALDFLTIEDSLGIQSADRFAGPDSRADQVRGRLDAVLIAARIAPLTSHIGIVPTAVTTHTEPFHLSTALATLDYVSEGRAGWRARVSSSASEARHFGRRELPALTRESQRDPAIAAQRSDIFDEGADAVEAVRRLWDSWEDDAVIRDVPTGRFVDRDKLHYIDFEGQWFSVRGPSITPRPPQGQPVVVSLAHGPVPHLFAARASDIVFITPFSPEDVVRIIREVRAAEVLAGRSPAAPGSSSGPGSEAPQGEWGAGAPHPGGHRGAGPRGRAEPLARRLAVYADLVVFLNDKPGGAAARKRRLDALDGAEFTSDCATFAGTAGELADLLLDWRAAAGLDGFRLRPGALPDDLTAITRSLVPELRRRGAFRAGYAERTLRERLGLPRPASRYSEVPTA
jgi:alkanesulfonate monooxygenase SsuD/methylene tetrahydromethanopterin reductase-like flavin-dependent oxidoreductase (luciferase family)